ncbi:MAG TPA: hypothetical protein VLS53_01325 [Candidatus Dormibacteraeota bacterium]|nr:hypothetical protein [Candidatus Dormibacteraeota bacterium]
MKTLSLVLGIIALITGGIWILQGVGILPGSFMSGQGMWLVIGLVVAAAGLALIYNGIRRTAPR